jgi:WD40 repeat protein/serine/threonine protein kinase
VKDVQKIRAVFCEALKKETQQARDAYIARACKGDPNLREEVEALLETQSKANDFFKGPLIGPETAEDEISEAPGTVIGRYKLLEKIGEGGMAVVYMAEQKKPLRRRVALKIIKLGMDTKQVIARFEVERQALALMEHPNIAKVLDAGKTKTGRPYFVMELVRGVSITDYCDKNKLTTKDRLDLFVQICNAVQHAHQKGIIHRDIKPSNVMVTLRDGEPVPKVIDFGIAKATSRTLTEKTLFTRYAQMIGTPAYMSPEQAEMSELDIDTRTDIYSLGVLLYELLTGTTPFSDKQLREAGYVEMQRIICEQEPVKPSTRLSTIGDSLTDVAKHRNTRPDLLSKSIRGDLDWIVVKSLEKNRNRRYDTAVELVNDIEHHLNDEPIQAAAPSLLYKTRKFVRRNRVSVITTATIIAVILAGFIVSTVMYLRSEKMYVRSETMRVKAEEAGRKEADARLKAEQAESIAQKQRNEARRSLYCGNMLAARQDWEDGRVARLWELLDAHRPKDGDQDFRGWEWYYLQSLLNRDLFTLRGHTGAVNSVAWSPDRRHLASGSDDHTVRIWDTVEAKPISVLRGHSLQVNSVAWSPDGRYLASASNDETVRIWDWAAEEVVHTLTEHKQKVHSVTWSPDGKQLASAGKGSTVRIWDSATGKESFSLSSKERTEPICSVAWSPDGQWLAAGYSDFSGSNQYATVILWNVLSRQHRQLHDRSYDPLYSVAWNPDSQLVASATRFQGMTVWDASTGKMEFDLDGHKGPVKSAFWSPDGKRLASASADQTVKIWDPATKEVLITLCGHTGAVNSVAWSPDGRMLVTGSEDGSLKIWDATRTEEALATRRYDNWVNSVSWSPDSKRLTAAHMLPTFGIWDPLTGEESPTFHGHTEKVWQIAWSPDNKRLATASKDETVKIWDAAGGPALFTLDHKGFLISVEWSPDGKKLASVCRNVIVWNATTGELISTLRELYGVVKWSPDGRQLASASKDKTYLIWDVNTNKVVMTFPGHAATVYALAWSPDGGRLAGGSEEGKVTVWEVSSGREVFSVQAHTSWARAIVWSPDGRRLASGGGDGTIKIRDAATGEEVLTIRGHEAEVHSIAWSPDGRRLASGSFDGTMKVWDASIGYDLENDPNFVVHRVENVRRRSARAYMERGIARARENKFNQAINIYESAIEADPSYVLAYNHLAWLLATCPRAEVRDGVRAIKNATKACELTNWKNYSHISILAAAYAEAGDFEQAVKRQQEVIELLTEEERSRHQLIFEARLKLYQARQTYHRQPLFANQMIAHWTFDQVEGKKVLDSSGNELHGKLQGDAQIISDPQRNSVLSLDGDGDYVDCGNSSVFEMSRQITVSAWIKVNTFDKKFQAIVTKGDKAWRLQRENETDALQFACTGLKVPSDRSSAVRGKMDVNDGKWHHVVGVYDGTKMCLYLDGELDVSASATGSIKTNSDPVYIGENGERRRFWNGLIDDVRIYSYALSEEEIEDLFVEDLPERAARLQRARRPEPADGGSVSVGLTPYAKLTWKPGREAVTHHVYFGTEPNKLELLGKVEDENSTRVAELEKFQWYYWRVDAVKSDGSVIKGKLWRFSTGQMVGWWKFDGDAVDSSGNQHHGSEIGNPEYMAGIRGQALDFDGSSQYVEVPHSASLGLTKDFTIAAWIRPDVISGSHGIVTKVKSGLNKQYCLTFRDGELRFDYELSGNNYALSGGTVVTAGNWQHVAVTVDSSLLVNLYINAASVAAETAPGEVIAQSNPVAIGRWSGTYNDYYFDGLIDDVRIYSYVLSKAEIKELYAGRGPGPNKRPE